VAGGGSNGPTVVTKLNNCPGPVQGGTPVLARRPRPNSVSAPPRKMMRTRHVPSGAGLAVVGVRVQILHVAGAHAL
jgi:hypothetical protein